MRKRSQAAWASLLIIVVCCSDYAMSAACRPSQGVCEFWLVVQEALTMQHMQRGLLIPYRGQIYAYNDTNHNHPITDGFIQGDGFWDGTRMVMAVNGSVPGPTIEVYENQTVVVHVTNHLETESMTMHWHGVHQVGTPFMDGVPMITQCPIQPAQSFDYRFLAWPEGTHWYHSHSGVQRTNGVYGAFIVHPRDPPRRVQPTEHVMLLADWTHDYDSMTAHLKAIYGLFIGPARYTLTSSLDGLRFGPLRFQSGLINGRGRFWSSPTTHNGAPLEVFSVQQSTANRFRVVGAMGLYPFRVSVDQHRLRIVALDGFRVVPAYVDSFVIYPGERVDFVLEANAPVANYWIRAATLEHNLATPHIAEAVLHYKGATPPLADHDTVVSSRPRDCTDDEPCSVLNCPFTYYPRSERTRCVSLTSLQSSEEEKSVAPDGPYTEVFMNFAITPNKINRGSVNWISYKSPSTLGYAGRSGFVNCTHSLCKSLEQGPCRCTNTLELAFGEIYQLVFTNLGIGKGIIHPMHMHGHTFHVVKVGFGEYNRTTGLEIADNQDIRCNDDTCSRPSWRNTSWSERGVPDLPLQTAIQKDTVVVPSGGYVIIRVRAVNPGLWFMHCHIDLHQMEGMALLIDSARDRRPPLPDNFPTCREYRAALDPINPPTATNSKHGPVNAFWNLLFSAAALAMIK